MTQLSPHPSPLSEFPSSHYSASGGIGKQAELPALVTMHFHLGSLNRQNCIHPSLPGSHHHSLLQCQGSYSRTEPSSNPSIRAFTRWNTATQAQQCRRYCSRLRQDCSHHHNLHCYPVTTSHCHTKAPDHSRTYRSSCISTLTLLYTIDCIHQKVVGCRHHMFLLHLLCHLHKHCCTQKAVPAL